MNDIQVNATLLLIGIIVILLTSHTLVWFNGATHNKYEKAYIKWYICKTVDTKFKEHTDCEKHLRAIEESYK